MGTYLVQRFGEAIPVVPLSSVLIFLGLRLIPGDLGLSFFTRAPISQLLAQRAPASLELALAPLLVKLSLTASFAALVEAGLAFLGLGTQPPDPSWGTMLADSRAYLREAPWLGLWPGVALTILLVGLNYFTDALDPRRARTG